MVKNLPEMQEKKGELGASMWTLRKKKKKKKKRMIKGNYGSNGGCQLNR